SPPEFGRSPWRSNREKNHGTDAGIRFSHRMRNPITHRQVSDRPRTQEEPLYQSGIDGLDQNDLYSDLKDVTFYRRQTFKPGVRLKGKMKHVAAIMIILVCCGCGKNYRDVELDTNVTVLVEGPGSRWAPLVNDGRVDRARFHRKPNKRYDLWLGTHGLGPSDVKQWVTKLRWMTDRLGSEGVNCRLLKDSKIVRDFFDWDKINRGKGGFYFCIEDLSKSELQSLVKRIESP
ncbi:MAG: hypothetical protein AAF492_25075, partial [Verrucomicrobiota bacterium]